MILILKRMHWCLWCYNPYYAYVAWVLIWIYLHVRVRLGFMIEHEQQHQWIWKVHDPWLSVIYWINVNYNMGASIVGKNVGSECDGVASCQVGMMGTVLVQYLIFCVGNSHNDHISLLRKFCWQTGVDSLTCATLVYIMEQCSWTCDTKWSPARLLSHLVCGANLYVNQEVCHLSREVWLIDTCITKRHQLLPWRLL